MESAELNRKLDAIMDMATRTSQDVTWIKAGMETGARRMDTQDTKIGELNGRMSRMQGSTVTLSTIASAIFGGIIAYFVKAHT
jgi:archaellum component FlaC